MMRARQSSGLGWWREMQTPGRRTAPGATEPRYTFLADQVLPRQEIFTGKHLTNSELEAMWPASRSTLRGAPSGGVLKAGNGSGTCERWETQPRPRAVLGQPRRPIGAGPVRPRSKA